MTTSTLIATLGAVLLHHSLSGVDAGGAHGAGPGADGLAMDGAGDAVVELDVELGELVLVDDAGLVEIAQGALVDDVTHGEALDGLVLRRLAAAPVAHDQVRVVAAVAVTPVVAALHSHVGRAGEGESCGIAGVEVDDDVNIAFVSDSRFHKCGLRREMNGVVDGRGGIN